MLSVDELSLATETARILGSAAVDPNSGDGSSKTLETLITIFPWLGEFYIKRDGSDYRWMAMDHSNPEQDIVFTTPQQAMIQVRDWILQRCREEGNSL